MDYPPYLSNFMKYEIIASGGLGNQMFEYAYYLSLKSKGYDVRINKELYNVSIQHNGWELDRVFKVTDKPLPHSAIRYFLTRIVVRYSIFPLIMVEKETMGFDPIWRNPHRPLLKGVWINSKYFEDIEDTVRNTFIFSNIDEYNLQLASRIQSENSVSIHIRRGDYLNLPQYNVCQEGYYKKAIAQIKELYVNPIAYVFSNDPTWCDMFMKQFDIQYTVINHNQGEDSYKDMFLMSQCKHNIIANSTFSWWGAWLNNNPDKCVISPRFWFTNKRISPNLSNWIQL